MQQNDGKSKKVIILPRCINESWSNALMQRLRDVSRSDEIVVLDATRTVWLAPFGTILLADFAYKRLEEGRRVDLRMPEHQETANYIGASGLLNLTTSTSLSDAIDSTKIQLRLLRSMEPFVPETLSDFIINQASNVGDDERYLLRTWITELLTNANDHAESMRGFWVCGRYNPHNKDIRICVADSGIGIKRSLVNSGKLPANITDAKAIERALEEGMTSRMGKTGGLGLKHISSYVKSHGGSMTILSGKGKVYIARKMKKIKPLHLEYQGTIVNVKFDTQTMSTGGDISQTLTPFQFE